MEQQFIRLSSAEACLFSIFLNEKQKHNCFTRYFFLKFNPCSQKSFSKLWTILNEASGVQQSIAWMGFA